MANTARGSSASSLRQDVRHLREEAHDMHDNFLERGRAHLSDFSHDIEFQVNELSSHIRSNPLQSIALAFGAGALACMLFSKRR